MGDTVTISINENWQQFYSTIGESFSFNDPGPNIIYIRESALAPDADETGFIYHPGEGDVKKVESSPFWVRTKEGASLFHFGKVEIEEGGGSGDGDVVGPASAVNDRIATFDGITGKLIQDSGGLISDLGDVVGPVSAVDENIAVFDTATGKLIKDSGVNISGVGAGAFPIEVITADPHALVVDDNLKFFVMDSAGQIDVIIPSNASQPFPIGAEMNFIREGVGTVLFFSGGLPAVLQSRDGLFMINAQYSAVTLKKIDTDEWRLIGDLA